MLSSAQPMQTVSFSATQLVPGSVGSRTKGSAWATGSSVASRFIRALGQRALGGRVLVAERVGGAEELGDDLDREHAGDPALGVDGRRVLRLGLEQVGQRVAHHVVE